MDAKEKRKAAKRAYMKEYYARHKRQAEGKPKRCGGAPLRAGQMEDRVVEFREQVRLRRDCDQSGLRPVCEFCLHNDTEVGLLQRRHCVVDRLPGVTGGCDAWQPRYRTRDEEDDEVPGPDTDRAETGRAA
jgi:hypothetical protein